MADLPRTTEDAMHRRSAALVFADVVGYSRLMATDELGTYVSGCETSLA